MGGIVIPYIPKSKRKYWDGQFLFDEKDPDLTHPRTLEYLIVKLCKQFVKSRGGKWDDENLDSVYGALFCSLLEIHRRKGFCPSTKSMMYEDAYVNSYTIYNDNIGRHARIAFADLTSGEGPSFYDLLDFYTRFIAPYEDKKIKENLDVF